jgi:hypothetical protein
MTAPTPFLIDASDSGHPLSRVAFVESTREKGFDEAWLQKVLFQNPDLLPCEEIDPAYDRLFPLCREMQTRAGPIDLVYVTQQGKLVLVETKLWRNPESRRKVVAQTLDYAKEVCLWDYSALEKTVRGARADSAFSIFRHACSETGPMPESTFCDNVSRTLRTGQFMLLIVGDGIREGVGAMTEFLEKFGSLQFSFGLVELAVFDGGNFGRLVVPRVLAKTTIIKRTVVTIEGAGRARVTEEAEPSSFDQPVDDQDPKTKERASFYRSFWSEFLAELRLDDETQPRPQAGESTNIFFPMPPSGSTAWVSAYFAQSKGRVGVYLTFAKGSGFGLEAWSALRDDREAIEEELGFKPEWLEEDGKYWVGIRSPIRDVTSEDARQAIKHFFAEKVNKFVSVFRPRLERIANQL